MKLEKLLGWMLYFLSFLLAGLLMGMEKGFLLLGLPLILFIISFYLILRGKKIREEIK